MKYLSELDVNTFPFWSGAKHTVDEVRKAGKMDDLQQRLEDYFGPKIPAKTEINDVVWFGREGILRDLGLPCE